MVQCYSQQFRHWELFGSSRELVRWQNCNMFTNRQQCSWFIMRERSGGGVRERKRVTVSHLIHASSHPHVCGGDIPVYTDGYLWLWGATLETLGRSSRGSPLDDGWGSVFGSFSKAGVWKGRGHDEEIRKCSICIPQNSDVISHVEV